MFSIEKPNSIMEKVKEYFEDQKCLVKESKEKYKMQACHPVREDKVVLNVRLEEANENVRCIRLEKVSGNKMDFLEIFKDLKHFLAEKIL